jgi:hypothetical protein
VAAIYELAAIIQGNPVTKEVTGSIN